MYIVGCVYYISFSPLLKMSPLYLGMDTVDVFRGSMGTRGRDRQSGTGISLACEVGWVNHGLLVLWLLLSLQFSFNKFLNGLLFIDNT